MHAKSVIDSLVLAFAVEITQFDRVGQQGSLAQCSDCFVVLHGKFGEDFVAGVEALEYVRNRVDELHIHQPVGSQEIGFLLGAVAADLVQQLCLGRA